MRKIQRKNPALPIHELAEIVPLANEIEQDSLNESIAINGFDKQLGLIMLFNGEIVDGRCRQVALLKAGLIPSDYAQEISYTEYEDVKNYVLQANQRRNLTDTQKAISAWKMTKREKGRMTQQEVSNTFGITIRTLQAINSIVKSIDILAKSDIDIYYIREHNVGTKRVNSKTRQLSGLVDDLFNDYKVMFPSYSKGTTSIRMIASHLKNIYEDVTEQSAIEWNPDSMIVTEAGKQWFTQEVNDYNIDPHIIHLIIELANFKFPISEEDVVVVDDDDEYIPIEEY